MTSYLNRACKISLLLTLTVLLLAGCGDNKKETEMPGKVNVVTSFYPIYEFATAIGGEDAHVVNLLPTGVEPHEWTPRSKDILNTSKAALFLYNGAGLEGWAPNFMKGLGKDSKVKAVQVSQGISLIESNGEDEHEGHSHEGENGHDHGDESGLQVDPHTWVSPKSALIMARNIKDSYIEIDPEHKDNYESRYAALHEKLEQLDAKFTEELSRIPNKEIVVSHQAFGYLSRDYNLSQHAIMGLSPEAEPRAQDLISLSKFVKEQGIKYIFFEELVSDRLAKTLASEAGVKTLVLNPVEGLTKEQEQAGDNYFTLMEKNLQNLLLALQ